MTAFNPWTGPHFKHQQVPKVVAKHQRKVAAQKALADAYAIVNKRDGDTCRVTGEPLSASAKVNKHLREHHHLRGRNVKPEWVTDPDRIILVSKLVHDLIGNGWIVVEGDDARKALRFFWAEHVKPEQRIFRIRSRRRSQQK